MKNLFMAWIFMLILFLPQIEAQSISISQKKESSIHWFKIDRDQLLLENNTGYVLTETGLVPISGYVEQDGDCYIALCDGLEGSMPTRMCDHGRGCFKCKGCCEKGCWNYCNGKCKPRPGLWDVFK